MWVYDSDSKSLVNADELQHHGVKGMKWGVITWIKKRAEQAKNKASEKLAQKKEQNKKSKEETKIRKASEKKESDTFKAKKVLQSKKVEYMSEEELNKRIQRLELEKKYKELSQQVNPPGNVKTFIERFGKSTARKLGDEVGPDLIGRSVMQLTRYYVKKKTGVDLYSDNNKGKNQNNGKGNKSEPILSKKQRKEVEKIVRDVAKKTVKKKAINNN